VLLLVICGRISDAAVEQQEKARDLAGTKQVRVNFKAVPLDNVLEYLSDAGGFIINREASANPAVTLQSSEPVHVFAAVRLLNSVLKTNGLQILYKGRILTVLETDQTKTADLEIEVGNDPNTVAATDDMVTQVIPVRQVNVTQLVNNLQPLLPAAASLTANESANSLVLVASRRDVRRMLRIIKALDNARSGVSTVRVFPVRFADARQLASAIQQVFGTQSNSQSGGADQQQPQFAPGGAGQPGPGFDPDGGFRAPFGGPEATVGESNGRNRGSRSNSGMSAAPSVVAVADETSNCVVVRAPPDTMPMIEEVVTQIDVPVTDVTEVRVFRLQNADPSEFVEQLGQLFPDVTRSNTDETTTAFPPGGPPFLRGLGTGGPPGTTASAGESSRVRKLGQVVAVADSRTSSLIVRAASARMPQIEAMIRQLDANSSGREIVKVWDLKNANPEVVKQVMQDLFQRNVQQTQGTDTQEQDPLQARQIQMQNNPQDAMFGRPNGTAQGGGSFPE
jgi:type II secretory pathway component GspD/PulD (secretin)